MRKYWTKERPKKRLNKLQTLSSRLITRFSSELQLLSVLFTATHFSLLDWFHSLLAVFLSIYPTCLASTTSWGLQGKLGFTYIASYNGLSRTPFLDTLDTCLASLSFFSCGRILLNTFLFPLNPKPQSHDQRCQVLLLTGLKHDPLIQLHLH